MPASAVIELRDVDISVDGRQLVRRLSVDISPGRVLAIVSAQADVRTALVRVLSGDTRTYSVGGDLVMDGRELISRAGNGTQAEQYVVHIAGPLDARTRLQELADPRVLDRVGLPVSGERVSSLPIDGRVRAAFAAALTCDPRVVVLDLPYASDADTVYPTYSALLHSISRDTSTAFVVSTDSLAVAADIADEVLVLLDGRVVEAGSVYDICLRPAMPYVRDLVRLTPSPHRAMPDFAGFVDLAAHQGCPWVLNCQEDLLHACSQEAPALRQVALGHAAACHRIGGQSA